MKEYMKKFVALGLALGLMFVGSLPSLAANAVTPKDRGASFINPSFVGLLSARVSQTATAQELVSAQGLLYAICPSGGTLGKYTVAFNYSLSEGANFPDNPFTTTLLDGGKPMKYAISPTVPTRILSSQWGAGGQPYPYNDCWIPPYPVQFTKLVGASNDAGHEALFLYRLTDGTH